MVAGARWGPRVRFRLGAFLPCGRSMGDDTSDCSVDAEWIMEKNDWGQQRQQKAMR
jgi:hypothetical protein